MPEQPRRFPVLYRYLPSAERAQHLWHRYGAFLTAVLLHALLLAFVLPHMINDAPPPLDTTDVTVVPPPAPPAPKPKPVKLKPPPKPQVKPAETNQTAGRASYRPPRLPHIYTPPIDIKVPPPLTPNPPMTVPAAAKAPTPGTPGGNAAPGTGQGGAGNGNGQGTQEGNDYLIRIKSYIDAHKNGERHREPNDADLVLVLDPDGNLLDLRVTTSSGEAAVDQEIMSQLRQMSPFPKPPPILFAGGQTRLAVADKWIFPRP